MLMPQLCRLVVTNNDILSCIASPSQLSDTKIIFTSVYEIKIPSTITVENKDLVVTIKFKIPAPLNTTLKRTFYKDSLVMEIFMYLDIMFYDDIKNYTLFVYPREEISKDYELNLIGDIIKTSCICFIVNNEL